MTAHAGRSLGLDLGTTSLKLAVLGSDGELGPTTATPAPRPAGAGLIREVDVEAYRAAAEALLAGAPTLPLGIASQRSSFVLFERDGGRPRTPLVSWQDRRAASWCDRRRDLEPELRTRTGLPLSAHYAGPKLAALFESDARLRPALESGALLFGTLETYLTWHWSGGEHLTDLSMAARTQLVDLESGAWSPHLLELFGVPRAALPTIAPSTGRDTQLAGGRLLSASLADQAASLTGATAASGTGTLINLGTGTFVLRATGSEQQRRPGYLTGPVLGTPSGRTHFALEGTINGGGATVDRMGPGPTELPAQDPTPEAFCLPDENGVGAPHWRPQLDVQFSAAARGLAPADLRRIALEGLVFRVREICDDLDVTGDEQPILLSGGLTREPFLAPALAACLGREVHVLLEEQTTLLGAARLAAGSAPDALGASDAPRSRRVTAGDAAWLRPKFERWRAWFDTLLQN